MVAMIAEETPSRTREPRMDAPPACPHCGTPFCKWLVPEGTSWSEEFFYVCFNDSCSYYREGWEWMKDQYHQKASYRYMMNPTTGASAPLPVWSDAAMREMIVVETGGG
jgi:hypothetical protein